MNSNRGIRRATVLLMLTTVLFLLLACNAAGFSGASTTSVPSPTPLGGGQVIAYGVLTGEATDDIYLYEVGSGQETRLTDMADSFIHGYTFSPDGRQLVFASNFHPPDSRLYRIDVDGGNLKLLVHNEYRNWFPAWSPDGGQIAFASDKPGQFELFLMDSDGANIKQLTDLFGEAPDWSPDGRKLAIQSDVNGDLEILTMNVDGTALTRLTFNRSDERFPKWSPDGTGIAFSSDQDGNGEIYLMDADGSNPRNLTMNPADEAYFSWSPDGRNLVFDSDRDGTYQIYVLNIDSGAVTRLPTQKDSFNPVWSP